MRTAAARIGRRADRTSQQREGACGGDFREMLHINLLAMGGPILKGKTRPCEIVPVCDVPERWRKSGGFNRACGVIDIARGAAGIKRGAIPFVERRVIGKAL